ncbi:MAG: PAS domain S-box protein [Desulfobulbaceae bacterium]|nr:PAS domain S-box protein [Desulfobulbaceae bacterium]HIJ77885.1 PAS domain S-box protein [Deltaproteobacteria bacterium]
MTQVYSSEVPGDSAGPTESGRDWFAPFASRDSVAQAHFEAIFNSISDAVICVDKHRRIVLINPAVTKLWGYTADELLGKDACQLYADKKDYEAQGLSRYRIDAANDVGEVFEMRYRRKDGSVFSAETLGTRVVGADGAVFGFVGIHRDISERKQAEAALEKTHAELVEANRKLTWQIEERRQAEEALRASEVLLAKEKANLEEINVVLKVLLRKQEEEKREVQNQIVSQVKQLIEPSLHKLRKSGLNDGQSAILQLLAANLSEIVSPFSRTLFAMELSLTPAELQVANLVKEGKSSKEIAELVNLASGTIEIHRKNIRKKCGIANKKVNLRTYLLSCHNG